MHFTSGSHQDFLNRTRQELNRAERYCLFLSLVTFDFADFIRAIANRTIPEKIDLESVYIQIEDGVRNSLRGSDVISPIEKNRMGVLLVETSKTGTESVRQRIESFIRDFLKGQFNLPFEPEFEIQSASFPEESSKLAGLTSYFSRVPQSVRP